MTLENWSSVHNEPLVCVSVTTSDGDTYLTDTVDTSGNGHTVEYSTEVASTSLTTRTQSTVVSGASLQTILENVAKMKRQLQGCEDLDIVTYGCSGHPFNLLAKDVEVKVVKDNIVHIAKYCRNIFMPAACYKAAGGMP